MLIAAGLAFAIPGVVRSIVGWPWFQYQVVSACLMLMVPLGFLGGIGCFDYWPKYMIGARRCPRITPTTARTAGRTTSRSTPITR